MPSVAQFTIFLQVITLLGAGLTAFKLLSSGLFRKYRIFFLYCVFRVPYLGYSLFLGLSSGGRGSSAYFLLFIYTEPVIMLLYILIVVELYSLVLERYKGLYTLGRWAMYASILISVVISILTLLPKLTRAMEEPSRRVSFEIAAERGVDLSIVIFILLIVLFLSRYPVPLSRNVVVHTGIYSVFFLSSTLALLLRTVMGFKVNDEVNLCLSGLTSACSVAWWLLLSAKGEEVQVNVPQISPGSEERILQQLDSLNATLLKVSRQ